MRRLGHITIALLCSLAAMIGGLYLGSLFLMLFDSNYHDGFSFVGGLVIGLVAAIVVFRAVMKRTAPNKL
jgi:uncharacterized membrane protein